MKILYLKFLLWFSIFVFLLMPINAVLAHTESETSAEGIGAIITKPDLFTSKTPIAVWLEVKDKKSGQTIDSLDIDVKVQDSKGLEILKGKAELKGSEDGKTQYVFEISFPAGGEYKLNYKFIHDGEQGNLSFPVIVSEPVKENILTWNLSTIVGTVALGIILLVITAWGIFKKQYKKLAIILIIATVVGIVSYSLIVTLRSGALKSGVVTCLDNGQCFWTAHVHSYVVIKACGEEKILPTEVGSLSKVHTHEEQNVFHWHDRLPYDNDKKEILDTKPLTLGTSFDEIEITFDKGKVFDLTDGDSCTNGKAGSWKMFVNGQSSEKFREYIWQDKDVIVFVFDDRSSSEVGQELKSNPISFPTLGRE